MDYKGFNKVIIKNYLALPLISKTLDCLISSKILIKLDLKDAYYCIRIRRGDGWKMAFYTRFSHIKYLTIPFKVTNALATF